MTGRDSIDIELLKDCVCGRTSCEKGNGNKGLHPVMAKRECIKCIEIKTSSDLQQLKECSMARTYLLSYLAWIESGMPPVLACEDETQDGLAASSL